MSLPQILQQLNGAQIPNLSGVKQLMSMFQGINDPSTLLKSLMQNNQSFQQVMNVIQAHGNDPQRAFYALCEQKGIDPNQILSQLR